MRRTFRWALAVLLAALLGVAAAALFLTGSPSGSQSGRNGAPGKTTPTPIDETPLKTARDLAALATTPQEQSLSQEALRLADHEVDLAFSQSLRQAAERPAPVTPRTLRLENAVKQAQTRVDADQKTASQLTREANHAGPARKGQILQQLQLTEAELSLDQDELKDVRKALLSAGGGEEAQLQQLLDQHEKSESHAMANTEPKSEGEAQAEPAEATGGENSAVKASTAAGGSGLFGRLGAWSGLLHEEDLIERARSASSANAAEFGRERDALEREVETEQSKMRAKAGAKSVSVASALSSMHHLGQEQSDIASFGERASTEQVLARVYERWLALTQAEAQTALHRLIRSVFWILLVLFLAVVADLLISRLFSRFSFDRKRLHTIHSVLRFATRAIAAVIILIVIFGPPRQIGTILGLVGAGLAVALKDFIVAFLGWFRLIGPNGMRPGDWVEISGAQQVNGVQGKVLEVGLLFTVILESGNWTDAGHPTGRRVAFINSFAIEGYYFNFSTAGQWLWDEIQFGLPADLDPYPLLDSLRRVAEKETESNAKLAEQDWKRAMTGSGLGPFSAKSSITARPTEAGLSVVIRYIAHADEREELRQRLYHAAFEILHGARAATDRPANAAPRPETA